MRATGADAALDLVRTAAMAARDSGELPEFLAGIERVRVEVLLAPVPTGAAANPVEDADRLLSTADTAKLLGRSPWWVRQNKDSLPLVRLPTGSFGFSSKGLDRWLKRRSS
jgi:hypothetical protein